VLIPARAPDDLHALGSQHTSPNVSWGAPSVQRRQMSRAMSISCISLQVRCARLILPSTERSAPACTPSAPIPAPKITRTPLLRPSLPMTTSRVRRRLIHPHSPFMQGAPFPPLRALAFMKRGRGSPVVAQPHSTPAPPETPPTRRAPDHPPPHPYNPPCHVSTGAGSAAEPLPQRTHHARTTIPPSRPLGSGDGAGRGRGRGEGLRCGAAPRGCPPLRQAR
jgi:hypothetical protein